MSNRVSYTDPDYSWVKQQVNLAFPPGISPNQLIEISDEEAMRLGAGLIREDKPPRKYKIRQIIRDGNTIDWDYQESSGGKHKRSLLVPLIPDPKIYIEKTAHVVTYSDSVARLRILFKKRKEKFELEDLVELVKIKNDLTMFPMSVLYGKQEKGLKRDILFKSIVDLVKNQFEIIQKIQRSQKTQINKSTPEIIESIDALFGLEIDQKIILSVLKNKTKAKLIRDQFKISESSPLRNTINRLMK